MLCSMNSILSFILQTDAGVPVYFYELEESPSMLKKKRPSFVGSDHMDDIMFVFGLCFTEDQVIMQGKTRPRFAAHHYVVYSTV